MDIVQLMSPLMERMDEVTPRLSMIPWHLRDKGTAILRQCYRELLDNGYLFKGSGINQFFFGYHDSPDIVKAFHY